MKAPKLSGLFSLLALLVAAPVAVGAAASSSNSSGYAPAGVPHLPDFGEIEHDIHVAQAFGGGGAYGASQFGGSSHPTSHAGSRSSGSVQLLQSSGLSADQQAAIREDLAVMNRVIERAVGDRTGAPVNRAMGLDLMFLSGIRPATATYLEDYGAFFTLHVNFPLVEPPPRSTGQAENEEDQDTEWEAAHRDLFGGSQPKIVETFVSSLGGKIEAYEPEKVDQLIDGICSALKHALRIRCLDDSSHLLVCVQGPAAELRSSGHQGNVRIEQLIHPRNTGIGTKTTSMVLPGGNPVGKTILTLRVKMSDVRALTDEVIDSAEFRKRADTQAYISH